MQCPKCCSDENDVKDSRPYKNYIRRRRLCVCGHRYTTIEATMNDLTEIGIKYIKDIRFGKVMKKFFLQTLKNDGAA